MMAEKQQKYNLMGNVDRNIRKTTHETFSQQPLLKTGTTADKPLFQNGAK
jgi:hypothetical protein